MVKMDPGRSGPANSLANVDFAAGRASTAMVCALCVGLLVSSGVAYRLLASGYRQMLDDPIALPVPLARFPGSLNGWVGEDMNIPATTVEYMRKNFADDYISRRYREGITGQWADLYIVYCSSQPSGILGHKPTVCYPGNGWTWDGTMPSEIVTRSGRKLDCRVHRFYRYSPGYQEMVVVNFYLVNGLVSVREQDFSGFWARKPNIAGDPARYVAQVQVASTIETSAQALARDATDMILSFLPDPNGVVGVEVDYRQQESRSE
jgi:hypothetical protein